MWCSNLITRLHRLLPELQSPTALFQRCLCFGSHPTSMQLSSCVKPNPSLQLSFSVCKCPLLSTDLGRACIDVFALFKRKKRISSGLSFEFTRLLITDCNSSHLLNTWDYVAISFTWIISFNPPSKPRGKGINILLLQGRTQVWEVK